VSEQEGDGQSHEDDVREAPARYSRTTNGLLASLLVTVLAVGGFVAFRAAFRDDPSFDNGPIDYLQPVEEAQGAGIDLVYPRELPKGWRATSIDFVPGERPAWGIGMLTDDGRYVGIRQEDADIDELLQAYVDDNAEPGDESTFDSDLETGPWQTWADVGGDLAYSTELTKGDRAILGETLLVYGSASRDDQEKLIALLTMDGVG
jgi:hypothetical protein